MKRIYYDDGLMEASESFPAENGRNIDVSYQPGPKGWVIINDSDATQPRFKITKIEFETLIAVVKKLWSVPEQV